MVVVTEICQMKRTHDISFAAKSMD